MIRSTLVLIVNDRNELLLEDKKRGEFGAGKLIAPGGKKGVDESEVECAVRETFEEVGVRLDPSKLAHVGTIRSYRELVPWFHVDVFLTHSFSVEAGNPEMRHDWYSIDSLPYERFVPTDREWMPMALRGEHFAAEVFFGRDQEVEKFKVRKLRP